MFYSGIDRIIIDTKTLSFYTFFYGPDQFTLVCGKIIGQYSSLGRQYKSTTASRSGAAGTGRFARLLIGSGNGATDQFLDLLINTLGLLLFLIYFGSIFALVSFYILQ